MRIHELFEDLEGRGHASAVEGGTHLASAGASLLIPPERARQVPWLQVHCDRDLWQATEERRELETDGHADDGL